jgi:hypothetical protein
MKMGVREQYYQDEYTEMWIEDGILICVFSSGLIITEEVAIIAVRERIRISNGCTYPALIDATKIQYLTKTAREYLATVDGIRYLSCSAFLVNNEVQTIFINFFLMINKPAIPSKIFSDREEAINWLQKFKNKLN